ncbi:hypothetical protein G9A89_015871 [Geosiphon pyriformis]|nr:hypothetical protein G9A89_015871 [Geosiphon pyriformis]
MELAIPLISPAVQIIEDNLKINSVTEGTEDLNSETLVTYFQELNYNIIKYCKEKYSVQFKYSFDFESETETSNKQQRQTKKDFTSQKRPIQQQEPVSTSTNLLDYLQENESNHSESLKSEETEAELETEDVENKKEMAFTYIAKIPKFTREDSETSPQK